jgi:hypothetical protein
VEKTNLSGAGIFGCCVFQPEQGFRDPVLMRGRFPPGRWLNNEADLRNVVGIQIQNS